MSAVPYPNPLWSRIVSFTLAASYSSVLLFYPKAVIGDGGNVSSGVLTFLLWGVAAGFVHGVGFVPRLTVWRLFFHPALAWLAMGTSAWVVWA